MMLKLSHPLNLILAALTYTFGASIPAYLGQPFKGSAFWLGFACVLLAQWSMTLLAEVFRPLNEPVLENESLVRKLEIRNIAMYLSIAALATLTVLAFVLYIQHDLTPACILFLVLSLVLVLAYALPPFRMLDRGFGELTQAAHLAYVIPSVGFLLRAGVNHRLLVILIVPLTALALAYFLILNFTTFASDQKYQRSTFLRLLTWERAVPLHHGLIVFAYLLFAAAPIFGFSFNLIWPAFLTFPFAIFQILQVRSIAAGGPPNWALLTSTALSVFGLTAYFLTLTFWLR